MGAPPERPTPWLGTAGFAGNGPAGFAGNGPAGPAGNGPAGNGPAGRQAGDGRGGRPADGNTEWFAADPPTQPFPAVRESRENSHQQPVRQAPPLRDVPVRDIARAQEQSPQLTAPARAKPPAAGTWQDRTGAQDDAAWSPPRPRGPRTIPAPIKASFRWWVVAMGLAVVAMTLSIVLAVLYAGRYGTAAAGAATVGSILFEVVVLGAAGFVVVRMRGGDDWARTLLAGGGGIMALIVAMNTAGQFSFGSSLVAGFTTGIATVRLFEAAAAAVAIWYMFQPGAGKHFDPRGREE